MTGGHKVILCPYSALWVCSSSRWARHRWRWWWWREPCMLPRAFQWCGTTASFPAGMVPAWGGWWGGADLGVGTRMEEISTGALLQAFGSPGAGGVPGGRGAAGCTRSQQHGCRAPASLPKAAAGLGGGRPAVLLVPGQEGEERDVEMRDMRLCCSPAGFPLGRGVQTLCKGGDGPRLPPSLAWGQPCPQPHRRSCEHPTAPTSSSIPSSLHCWLTSCRPCCSASPPTPSSLLLNSLPPLHAASPPGPALPPPYPSAPSAAPPVPTPPLRGIKGVSSAPAVLLCDLGKLRHGEGWEAELSMSTTWLFRACFPHKSLPLGYGVPRAYHGAEPCALPPPHVSSKGVTPGPSTAMGT